MAKQKSVNERVLEAVKARALGERHGYGITTADRYVRSIAGNSQAFKRFGNLDTDTVIKEAAGKLTYCDEKMTFGEKFVSGNWKSSLPSNVFTELEKSVKSNVLMVFKNVVTTSSEDRDRDILHTSGADPDLKMPFLWQHIHTLPIGKMLMIDEHTDDMLKVWTVLFDMPGNEKLTQDAAILIENDALRISHGFIPKQIKDRQWKKGDDDERMPGFDIMKFHIMEESGVSVPSNTDAVIDLYASEKLKSKYARVWAKELHDGRGKVFNGTGSFPEAVVKGLQVIGEGMAAGGVVIDAKATSPSPPFVPLEEGEEENPDQFEDNISQGVVADTPADSVDGKETESDEDDEKSFESESGVRSYDRTSPDGKSHRKGVYVEVAGSYEWIRSQLRPLLKSKMAGLVDGDDCSCYVEATFSKHVIVECYDWDSGHQSYWQVDYQTNSEGVPEVTGIPVEVQLSSSVQPKEKEMKYSPKSKTAMKGLVRFLKSLNLTAEQKSELDVHGAELDSLLVANKKPRVWKQTEGGGAANPNEGEEEENPGSAGAEDMDSDTGKANRNDIVLQDGGGNGASGSENGNGKMDDDEEEKGSYDKDDEDMDGDKGDYDMDEEKSVSWEDVAGFLASNKLTEKQAETVFQITSAG